MRARTKIAVTSLSRQADGGWPGTVVILAPEPDWQSQVDGTCSICGEPALQDVVDAGGDVGLVHRTCFVRWDMQQEALEHMLAASIGFPHHAEATADLELEIGLHHAPAVFEDPSAPPEAGSAPQSVHALAA